MYGDTARYYDLIHSWKEYGADAKRLRSIIKEVLPEATSLLDAGCGTGRHLELFAPEFEIAGVDGSEAMLEVARERLGNAPLHQGDLRTFRLNRRFDVVTCLFGGICLLADLEEAGRAVANMVAHMKEGGLLILEPWVTRESFEEGRVDVRMHEAGESKVCVASTSRVDGGVAYLDMQYLIAAREGIVHLEEPLKAGLWNVQEYVGLLEAEGLDVEHDPVGLDMERGLFLGRMAE